MVVISLFLCCDQNVFFPCHLSSSAQSISKSKALRQCEPDKKKCRSMKKALQGNYDEIGINQTKQNGNLLIYNNFRLNDLDIFDDRLHQLLCIHHTHLHKKHQQHAMAQVNRNVCLCHD